MIFCGVFLAGISNQDMQRHQQLSSLVEMNVLSTYHSIESKHEPKALRVSEIHIWSASQLSLSVRTRTLNTTKNLEFGLSVLIVANLCLVSLILEVTPLRKDLVSAALDLSSKLHSHNASHSHLAASIAAQECKQEWGCQLSEVSILDRAWHLCMMTPNVLPYPVDASAQLGKVGDTQPVGLSVTVTARVKVGKGVWPAATPRPLLGP